MARLTIRSLVALGCICVWVGCAKYAEGGAAPPMEASEASVEASPATAQPEQQEPVEPAVEKQTAAAEIEDSGDATDTVEQAADGPAVLASDGTASNDRKSSDKPSENKSCTFKIYNWSVEKKRAVNRRTLSRDRNKLEKKFKDDHGCTICEEDQSKIVPEELGIPGVAPFRVCSKYKDGVERALKRIVESKKFDIKTIKGYRPGYTRGVVRDGLRTELSNHSFGDAIDINMADNGLYTRCDVEVIDESSIVKCRRRHGGKWEPKKKPRRSIAKKGVVVKAFKEEVGWKWGGTIEGNTKDFMHFSFTGK